MKTSSPAGCERRPIRRPIARTTGAAVAELAPKLDLREDLAVLGPDVDASVRTHDLLRLGGRAAAPAAGGRAFVLPLVASVSTGLVVQWIWTGEPPDWLVPALAVQGLLALRFRHAAHHVAHGIEQREQELRVARDADGRASSASRSRARCSQRCGGRLHVHGLRAPSDEIRRLARLVEILSSGHNQIFAPISALLLLGTQLAFAVERWRARCGPAVPVWLDAVAEYEALCALATLRRRTSGAPVP